MQHSNRIRTNWAGDLFSQNGLVLVFKEKGGKNVYLGLTPMNFDKVEFELGRNIKFKHDLIDFYELFEQDTLLT